MSTCLSGGRAFGFAIEIVKSPSTSSRISQSSSSPSSTISESSNSPVAISTRKPRTPRKRPNQTYNEAATLLSTACPNVFSTKHIKKISKFTPQHNSYYFNELPELVLPFRVIENSGFLLHPPLLEQPPNCLVVEQKVCGKPCLSPAEINSSSYPWNSNSMELTDDFDTESMLDEEMGEGIDSIMGNLITENEESSTISCYSTTGLMMNNTCYGFPMGLGFEFGFGMRNSVRALRKVDEGNWWRFPTVDIADIIQKPPAKKVAEGKKKKKKVEKAMSVELKSPELNSVVPIPEPRGRLLLKLNYEDVLESWSDRRNPLPDEISGSESPGGTGNDIHAKLAQIDLFSENGGLREASVMRYKEKRRNRLFSKKIRYQVRKVNADRRPRMKGRFVRRPNSPISEEG